MKKRGLPIIFLAVLIAFCTAFFAGCDKYTDMNDIGHEGSYRFVTHNYITTDGTYVYLPRKLNQAVERHILKTNVYSPYHAIVPTKDGAYFGYVFYYGEDETYFDFAIGYIDYTKHNKTSVYAVVQDVNKFQSISQFGNNRLIFVHNGEYKIFDCKTKKISVLEIPEKFSGYELLRGIKLNGYFVIEFKDAEFDQSVFYILDGNGGEYTVRADGDAYPLGLKEGYLILNDSSDGDMVLGINITSGEQIGADEASELYNKGSGKFYVDGKEYGYLFDTRADGEDNVLTITDEDGESRFTVGSLVQTVPEIREAFNLYSANRPDISRVYVANGEFYITVESQPGMFGYSNITPPLVLKYDPYNGGFSYVGFYPDHGREIISIQKL